jgi:inner membrane protein
MDSLTQFVLGAAVGHLVLGRHMGIGKAMLIGGLAGTIPDLDIIPLSFTDMVTSLELHRSLSHSLLFCAIAPALLAKAQVVFSKTRVSFWRWYHLWFWGFFTHILIDACTTWGTQFFWPIPYRVSFNSVFIIDPLYTLPLIIALIIAWAIGRKETTASPIAQRITLIGILISSAYLVWGGMAKTYINHQFEVAFHTQNIKVTQYMTRPTPFNSILWAMTAETEDGYFTGYRSLFDTSGIQFSPLMKKGHEHLVPHQGNPELQTLLSITGGYYRVEKQGDAFAIHDLRFGDFGGWRGTQGTDVFTYIFTPETQTFHRATRNIQNPKAMMTSLWERLW